MVRICRRFDAYLFFDEVYRGVEAAGVPRLPTTASLCVCVLCLLACLRLRTFVNLRTRSFVRPSVRSFVRWFFGFRCACVCLYFISVKRV